MLKTLELSGAWDLRRVDEKATVGAQVPGDVYNALLRARKIPDPFYRDNENDLQWIGESDWVFSRTFRVGTSLLKRDRVLLRCEGLDTFATIRINGRKAAVGR